MTKYKKYREKYVHDDINRNIKAKCQTKKPNKICTTNNYHEKPYS